MRALEGSTTAGELQVDLPELRGYAVLLDQVRSDLGAAHAQAETYCRDADFGKILEDLTGDYAALLPQLVELLAENEQLMKQYALAVDRQAMDYERTDDHVSDGFGGAGITGSATGTARFAPTASSDHLSTPGPTEGELPQVSFGFLFDKLAWALDTFTGFDVRASVTDWIAGDVVGLSTHASCWELVSQRLECCERNIAAGQARVYATWGGLAANQHASGMIVWGTALQSQTSGLADLAQHLKELCVDAVDTAQFVVDCIRLAIDLVTSAWALQYIPVYGQAKFVQKAWDAYKTASKATAYLRMLWSAIRAVRSFLVMCLDQLHPSMLPAKPLSV